MNELVELDKSLFGQINRVWTHPWLDQVMPILTDLHQQKWLMFGVLPLVLVYWLYRQRMKAVRTIVLIALSVALSDAFSYRLVKPYVERPRPQYSGVPVELRTNSHSGKSFPSNHAANNFAAAQTLGFVFPTVRWLFFLIALTVAYSRVYVGVHFPLDVTGGAAIGLMMATLVWYLIGKRWMKRETSQK